MTTTITFSSRKAGQGVTTVALAAALAASQRGKTIFVSKNEFDTDGIVAGNSLPDNLSIADRLPALFGQGYGYLIRDGKPLDTAINILVTRACYLSLKREVSDPVCKYDGFVLVQEPGRALTETDVSRALGIPHLATVPFLPNVSRAIDAGLFMVRTPDVITTPISNLFDKLPVKA